MKTLKVREKASCVISRESLMKRHHAVKPWCLQDYLSLKPFKRKITLKEGLNKSRFCHQKLGPDSNLRNTGTNLE